MTEGSSGPRPQVLRGGTRKQNASGAVLLARAMGPRLKPAVRGR